MSSADLSYNRIGPEGAAALGEALAAATAPSGGGTDLNLAGNGLCGVHENGAGLYDAAGMQVCIVPSGSALASRCSILLAFGWRARRHAANVHTDMPCICRTLCEEMKYCRPFPYPYPESKCLPGRPRLLTLVEPAYSTRCGTRGPEGPHKLAFAFAFENGATGRYRPGALKGSHHH